MDAGAAEPLTPPSNTYPNGMRRRLQVGELCWDNYSKRIVHVVSYHGGKSSAWHVDPGNGKCYNRGRRSLTPVSRDDPRVADYMIGLLGR